MPPRFVRILFVATVLAVPVQYVPKMVWSEPYPGLFQPSFGGVPASPGFAEARHPSLEVYFEDGSTETVGHRDLLYDAEVLPQAVFDSAFLIRPENGTSAESLAWVKQRVEAVTGKSPATGAEVVFTLVQYDTTGVAEPTDEVLQTLTLDFEKDVEEGS